MSGDTLHGLFCPNCGHLKEFDREHECPKANAWDVMLTQSKRITELSGENGVLANDLSSAEQELERVVAQLAAARSAVEKAPHDPTCRSISAAFIRFDAELREKFGQTIDVTCNCWRGDTLALLKGE